MEIQGKQSRLYLYAALSICVTGNCLHPSSDSVSIMCFTYHTVNIVLLIKTSSKWTKHTFTAQAASTLCGYHIMSTMQKNCFP